MSSRLLTQFSTRIFNTPLLIDMAKMETILGVLGKRIGLDADSLLEINAALPQRAENDASDSIAVIPVYGTLVHRASGLDAMSGIVSYEQIGRQFKAAVRDPSISQVVLDIDSYGGEVAGCFDLVDEIYQARNVKPVTAVLNENAFSAAYAIASAAQAIYMPRTGGAGSIGVIAIHADYSKFEEKVGVKYTPIFAGARKNDFSPHSELPETVYQSAKAEINEIWEIFINTVARNRGLSAEAVRKMEAGIFQGDKAVEAGLVDEVLSHNQAFKKIQAEGERKNEMNIKDSLMNLSAHGKPFVDALSEMGYEPKGAAEANLETATAAAMVSGKKAGRDEAMADIKQIADYCNIAGMPEMFAAFVSSGASVEDARKKIMDAKAEGSREEIFSTVSATGSGEQNPLIADARERAKGAM